MNARGFRSMSVTLLLLGASVAIMAASSQLQVTAGRKLTIAIVDSQRTTPERAQYRVAVAALLKEVVADACGQEVGFRPMFVSGREAKQKLNGGNFDAALVIGDDRPLALRRLNLVTLAGMMPTTSGSQPVSFILGDGDSTLNQRLRAAFARLLADPHSPVATVPQMAIVTAIGG